MKRMLLALLWGGTAALGQSPSAQSPVNPDQLFQMPREFAEASEWGPPAFDNAPARNPLPQVMVLAPPPRPQNPPIDPKMIVRPRWPARGDGQKGRDMSSDQYPNLRLLPLRGAAAGAAVKAGKACR